jgi:hypothetical protein
MEHMEHLRLIIPDDCTLKEALDLASPWMPTKRSDYRVGLQILARFASNGNYYPCKITAINEGGTYAVQFDDGEMQEATLFNDTKLKRRREKTNYSTLIKNTTIIILRQGTHNLDGNMCDIDTPIHIIGDGAPSKIIINGGLLVSGAKHLGTVKIEKVTIQSSKTHGIYCDNGMSCYIEDCIIQQCQECGVLVQSAKSRLVNVRVRNNGASGIASYVGAEVTLSAQRTDKSSKFARMIVEKNASNGGAGHYGLDAGYSSGNILTVYPLTKQEVASNNQGGGNWGGETIKRVTQEYDRHQQKLF